MQKTRRFRKDDSGDVVTMKKEEFQKAINAKIEEVQKQSKKDADDLKKELEEQFKKELKEEIEKAAANRVSIEDTGLDCFGDEVGNGERMLAKLEKSAKDTKVTDYDRELQKAHDKCAIIKCVFDALKSGKDVRTTKSYKKFINLVNKGNFLNKAGYDETTGDGLEWMPTVLSSRLVEYVEASGDFAIANLFERITMESSTFKIPREDGVVTAYKGSIGGTPTESHVSSGNSQFDAEKVIAYTNIYYEAEEDMIISALPLIERRLVKGISKGVSDAIINGDDSTTHMDSGVTASTDRRKLWKGLRKLCQTASFTKSIAAAWTDTKLRSWIAELDTEFYAEMNDLHLILPKNTYHQLRGLSEVRTKEKYGDMATIEKGVLTQIDGINVTLTSLLALVNSSGVVSPTAADNVKDQALVVYKPAFALGMRRGMMIESDKNIKTQNIDVVASMRADFQPLIKLESSADQECVVQAINITTI